MLHKWEMIPGAAGFNPRRRGANSQVAGAELEPAGAMWRTPSGAKPPRTPDGTQTCTLHSEGFPASLHYRDCKGMMDSNSWLFRGSGEFTDSNCLCGISGDQTDKSESGSQHVCYCFNSKFYQVAPDVYLLQPVYQECITHDVWSRDSSESPSTFHLRQRSPQQQWKVSTCYVLQESKCESAYFSAYKLKTAFHLKIIWQLPRETTSLCDSIPVVWAWALKSTEGRKLLIEVIDLQLTWCSSHCGGSNSAVVVFVNNLFGMAAIKGAEVALAGTRQSLCWF